MKGHFDFFFLESVNSTNDKIKDLAQNKKKSIALFSAEQTNGKGRSRNSWLSQRGDLTCSFFLYEKFSLKDLGRINIMISVCVLDAIKDITKGLDVKIKWPNDIYIGEKKLGGILIETKVSKEHIISLIIGVGVNLTSSPKIDKYKTTKISNYVSNISSKKLFLHLSEYIKNYFDTYKKRDFNFYKKKWMESSKDVGKAITIKKNQKTFNGKFKSINNKGELILETGNNNLLEFSFGEIV